MGSRVRPDPGASGPVPSQLRPHEDILGGGKELRGLARCPLLARWGPRHGAADRSPGCRDASRHLGPVNGGETPSALASGSPNAHRVRSQAPLPPSTGTQPQNSGSTHCLRLPAGPCDVPGGGGCSRQNLAQPSRAQVTLRLFLPTWGSDKLIRKVHSAFACVAPWIECQPVSQRVAGSVPSQGTGLG